MPATEKNANAFDMTTLSAVNSGYSLMLINNSTNEGQLITMTDLATMILNEIRNQTFTATELGQAAASTLPAAISSLNSAMIRYAPYYANYIHANADLNDYTELGTYYVSSAADAKTIANCPVSAAFRLDVINGSYQRSDGRYIYGFQRLIAYNSAERIYLRRVQTSGTANAWTYGPWCVFDGTVIS